MVGHVFILASGRNGTLYTGVTNSLVRRVYEHKTKALDGFSKKYAVDRLVYFEQHETMPLAIQREKNIKHWSRKWKLALIEKENPQWLDLFDQIT
jgi:putative endonuclease